MKLKTLSTLSIGLFAFAFAISPVLASGTTSVELKTQNNDTVTIENYASVQNNISSVASTGNNYAGGSIAGNGGNGGNATLSLTSQQQVDPKAGNGGDGGNVTKGGQITTGDASASTEVKNEVNTTEVTLERTSAAAQTCSSCEEKGCKSNCDRCNKCSKKTSKTTTENNDTVVVKNVADVVNNVRSAAKTGDNSAAGSTAGNGGNGGNASMQSHTETDGYDAPEHTTVPPVIAGNGGKGGSVEAGGIISTGKANTWTTVFNMINKNIVRLKR